jgi:hypothetical protein
MLFQVPLHVIGFQRLVVGHFEFVNVTPKFLRQ